MCRPLIVAWMLVMVTGRGGDVARRDVDLVEVLGGELGEEREALDRHRRLDREPVRLELARHVVLRDGQRHPVADHEEDQEHDDREQGHDRAPDAALAPAPAGPRAMPAAGAGGCAGGHGPWACGGCGDHCGGGVSCGSCCHCGCCHCCGRCCCGGCRPCVRRCWLRRSAAAAGPTGSAAPRRGRSAARRRSAPWARPAAGPAGGAAGRRRVLPRRCGPGWRRRAPATAERAGSAAPAPSAPAGCAGACTVGGAAVAGGSSGGGAGGNGCLVGSLLMVSPPGLRCRIEVSTDIDARVKAPRRSYSSPDSGFHA